MSGVVQCGAMYVLNMPLGEASRKLACEVR